MAAYMFDHALSIFGTIIENALLERTEPDDKGHSYPKHTLTQLLTMDYYLPRTDNGDNDLRNISGDFYDEVN